MYYSQYLPYEETFQIQNQPISSVYNYDHSNEGYMYNQYNSEDERFFGIIPFVAGLAIGPLLFKRPCCPPPYLPPFPTPYPSYPPMYPGYPVAPGFQAPFPPGAYSQQQQQQSLAPVYGGITENINIYTK